jgi:hypothetical protein
MNMQDIKPQNELIGDLSNEHIRLKRARFNSITASFMARRVSAGCMAITALSLVTLQ